MQPVLSIITINYNNALGLERTLKNFTSQEYKNVEYLVIDGGSSDESIAIIDKYKSGITFSISERDTGIYNAMNKGIAKATGEYLLFINSGDELNGTSAIKNVIHELHDTDLITCNLLLIADKSETVKHYPENPTFQYFLTDSFPHPATFIRKNLFSLTNGYDENYKIVSDWAFFMIALFRFNATHKHLSVTLSCFYMDGISTSEQNRKLVAKEKAHFISEQFGRYTELIKDWKEAKKLKFIFENSRLIKIARKMGFLKLPPGL